MVGNTQLKQLAKVGSSSQNFVATNQEVTKTGRVYYRVISNDNQYRGWIFGGNKAGKFGGGLKAFKTFKQIGVPTSLSKYEFTITTPGFANDGKNLTYTEPLGTVRGAKQTVGDAAPYKDQTFKVTKMGTRTREGDTWVYVQSTDSSESKLNGWILYSGLTPAEKPIAHNAIRIDIVNSAGQLLKAVDYVKPAAEAGDYLGINYSESGTPVWILRASDKQKIQKLIRDALAGTGYGIETISAAKNGFLAEAQFGGKTSLTALPTDATPTDSLKVNLVDDSGGVLGSFNYTKTANNVNDTLAVDNNGFVGLSDDDANALQKDVSDTLKKSGYSLTLSAKQKQELATTSFGNTVYLSGAKKTKTIADSAVRIKLIANDTGKTVTSIDYVNTDADDPAPKGSDLGESTATGWTLKQDDNAAITSQIVAALDGTGYQLDGNKLSTGDVSTIGAAKFGDSVSVNVLPANQ